MDMETRKLLLKAIGHFGVQHQTTKAVEELAELTAELTRIQDARTTVNNIREECADAMIMCEQVALMYGYDEVQEWKRIKLDRLKERIENENRQSGNNDRRVRGPEDRR